MREMMITLSEEIDEALAAYGRDRGATEPIERVVEAALHDFLAAHGYPVRSARTGLVERGDERALRELLEGRRREVPFRPFHITPIQHEGESDDISVNHDRYFADGELERPR